MEEESAFIKIRMNLYYMVGNIRTSYLFKEKNEYTM